MKNFHIILDQIRPKSVTKRVRSTKSGHCLGSEILVSCFLQTSTSAKQLNHTYWRTLSIAQHDLTILIGHDAKSKSEAAHGPSQIMWKFSHNLQFQCRGSGSTPVQSSTQLFIQCGVTSVRFTRVSWSLNWSNHALAACEYWRLFWYRQ